MARLTDTQLIRTYLENNVGGILDVSYDSLRVFNSIPLSNLRKYIARFVDDGSLRKISKGIYAIGGNKEDDKIRILKHYVGNGCGIPCGKTLLRNLGLISKYSGVEQYLTNKTIGKKNIEEFGIQLISTKSLFMPNDVKGIQMAIDLIANKNNVDKEKVIEFNELIFGFLKNYTNQKFQVDCEIRYSRDTYLALDMYLKAMGISNQVMDIYESKARVHVNKQ